MQCPVHNRIIIFSDTAFNELPRQRFVLGLFTDHFLNQIINSLKNIALTVKGRLGNIINIIKYGKSMSKKEKIVEALKAMYSVAVLAVELKRIDKNVNDINKVAAGLVKLIIDPELPLGFYFAFGELRPWGVTDVLVNKLYGSTIKIEEEKDKESALSKLDFSEMALNSFDKLSYIKLKNRIKDPVIEPGKKESIKKENKIIGSATLDKVKKSNSLSTLKEKAKKYLEKEFLGKSDLDHTKERIAYIKSILEAKPLGFGSQTKYIYIENINSSGVTPKGYYRPSKEDFENPEKDVYKLRKEKAKGLIAKHNISTLTEINPDKNQGLSEGKYLIRMYLTQTPYVFFIKTFYDSIIMSNIDLVDAQILPLEEDWWVNKQPFSQINALNDDLLDRIRDRFMEHYNSYFYNSVTNTVNMIQQSNIIYDNLYPHVFAIATLVTGKKSGTSGAQNGEQDNIDIDVHYYQSVFSRENPSFDFINFVKPSGASSMGLNNNNANAISDNAIKASIEILQRIFYPISQYETGDLAFLSRIYEAQGFFSQLGSTVFKTAENNSNNITANNIRAIFSGIAEKYLSFTHGAFSYLSKSNMTMPNFLVVSLEPFSKYIPDLPAVYPVPVSLPKENESGRIIYEEKIYYIYKDFLPIRSLQVARKDIKTDNIDLPGGYSFEVPTGWDAFGFSSLELEIFETDNRVLTKYFREYFRRSFFRGIARPVFDIAFILDIIVMNNQFELDDILSLIVVPTSMNDLFNINYDADEQIREVSHLKLSFSVIGFIYYGETFTVNNASNGANAIFGLDYATGAASFPSLKIKEEEKAQLIQELSRPNFYIDYLNGKISENLASRLQQLADLLLLGWYHMHTTGPWTGEYYKLMPGGSNEFNDLTHHKELIQKGYFKYVERKMTANKLEEARPINIMAGPFSKKYTMQAKKNSNE